MLAVSVLCADIAMFTYMVLSFAECVFLPMVEGVHPNGFLPRLT